MEIRGVSAKRAASVGWVITIVHLDATEEDLEVGYHAFLQTLKDGEKVTYLEYETLEEGESKNVWWSGWST